MDYLQKMRKFTIAEMFANHAHYDKFTKAKQFIAKKPKQNNKKPYRLKKAIACRKVKRKLTNYYIKHL